MVQEGGEDVDPEDLDSPTEKPSMSQGTLDMLACEILKKFVFQPTVGRCVRRLTSPHPHHRKADIACLGVPAEGCAEPLRDHLPDAMPHVFAAASDADAQVHPRTGHRALPARDVRRFFRHLSMDSSMTAAMSSTSSSQSFM